MATREIEYAKADPRFNKYRDETTKQWLRRVLLEVYGVATTGEESTDQLFHMYPSHTCLRPGCAGALPARHEPDGLYPQGDRPRCPHHPSKPVYLAGFCGTCYGAGCDRRSGQPPCAAPCFCRRGQAPEALPESVLEREHPIGSDGCEYLPAARRGAHL